MIISELMGFYWELCINNLNLIVFIVFVLLFIIFVYDLNLYVRVIS